MAGIENERDEEIAVLRARLAELEERVSRLETLAQPGRTGGVAVGTSEGATPSREGLAEAISQVLAQVGEADAGAIRQQLIKSGFAPDVARSEVNKALYASPSRFQIARQEGAKPLWKLVE